MKPADFHKYFYQQQVRLMRHLKTGGHKTKIVGYDQNPDGSIAVIVINPGESACGIKLSLH